MKYDLEEMDFDVEEARAALEDRAHLPFAFIWCEEPEEADSFWHAARDGRVPAEDWHPKVKAMIAQWEAENGEGDEPAAENQSREVRFYIPERDPGKERAVTVNMSLREYAAIKLRVPDSGTKWLDDMIREAKRDEFAGQALAGVTFRDGNTASWRDDPAKWLADSADQIADAMMAERKKGGAS